ncbi:hemerythrin domain-containing protein, partial [Mycobacterium avium]
MADITMLILADHDWFREQFARLDYLQAQAADDRDALQRVWRPLADKLDVHAYIEEKIFYP